VNYLNTDSSVLFISGN